MSSGGRGPVDNGPNVVQEPDDLGGMTEAELAVLDRFDAAEETHDQPSDVALALEWQTDLGNAKRFVARHGRDLRYVREIGWLAWQHLPFHDGRAAGRWKLDEAESLRRAHRTAEAMIEEAWATKNKGRRDNESADQFERRCKLLLEWAREASNHGKATAMVKSAAPYLALDMGDLDQQPYRLNVLNGTLHLGEISEKSNGVRLLPSRRDNYATKLANVAFDKDATAPRWCQFVAEVLPDASTRTFVQRWLGYCLTGDISEQRMVVFEGKGANGKSTLVDVVARLFDNYAVTVPVETFLHQERRGGSGPTPDLARLPGARLVRTSEPEPGARLSESTIKQFTGGERITARHLYRDMFEFKPQGKLTMSVNIRPVVVGKDHGIRRRIMVVPFRQQFPAGRRGLVEELLAEGPGVLNWLLDGYRLWREDGLGTCDDVERASKAYFEEMDPIGSFVDECCETTNPHAKEFSDVLWDAYKRWCQQSSEDEKSPTAFGRRLTDMGYARHKTHGQVQRVGLQVRAEWKRRERGEDASKG